MVVEGRVDNEVARAELITSVVRVNANARYRQKIESLPLKPKPTLEQMIEVCLELEPDPVEPVPPPPTYHLQKKSPQLQ